MPDAPLSPMPAIYVASPEGDTGKSAIALGILHRLAATVARVGIFRPITRVGNVQGEGRDYILELLLDHTTAGLPYEECVGVSYQQMHDDPDTALGDIVDRFHHVADQCDAVLVVGSDYTDVAAPSPGRRCTRRRRRSADRSAKPSRGVVSHDGFVDVDGGLGRAGGAAGEVQQRQASGSVAPILVLRRGRPASNGPSAFVDGGPALVTDQEHLAQPGELFADRCDLAVVQRPGRDQDPASPIAIRCRIGSGPKAENRVQATARRFSVPSTADVQFGIRPRSTNTRSPATTPTSVSTLANRLVSAWRSAYVMDRGGPWRRW